MNTSSDFRGFAVTCAVAAALITGPAAAQESLPLEQYVSQVFIHGVPYEETIAYGPTAVAPLTRILRDPKQEENWANAAVMLAMIGGDQATDAVLAFIRDPGAGEVSLSREWARRNALMALGYSAHGGRNKKALQYLEGSLKPGAWQQRGVRGLAAATARRPGTPGDDAAEIEEDEGSVEELLTHYAVLGLALSGTPEGRRAIETRRKAPGRTPAERAVLDSLLAEHAQIAKKGVAGYDRERRERTPAAPQQR